MSEHPLKRRLRDRRRIISSGLARRGYHVRSFDDGPFHLEAVKGSAVRRIRIVFGYCEKGDILSVSREPAPYRCVREIYQVSDDGRSTVIVSVKGIPPDPLKDFK